MPSGSRCFRAGLLRGSGPADGGPDQGRNRDQIHDAEKCLQGVGQIKIEYFGADQEERGCRYGDQGDGPEKIQGLLIDDGCASSFFLIPDGMMDERALVRSILDTRESK